MPSNTDSEYRRQAQTQPALPSPSILTEQHQQKHHPRPKVSLDHSRSQLRATESAMIVQSKSSVPPVVARESGVAQMKTNPNSAPTGAITNTEEAVSQPQSRSIVFTIQPNDVLFGRGTGPNENPGNKVFRKLMRRYAEGYKNAATRSERRNIVRKALALVHRKKTRFLRRVKSPSPGATATPTAAVPATAMGTTLPPSGQTSALAKTSDAPKGGDADMAAATTIDNKAKGRTTIRGPFEVVQDPVTIHQKVKLALRYAGGDEQQEDDADSANASHGGQGSGGVPHATGDMAVHSTIMAAARKMCAPRNDNRATHPRVHTRELEGEAYHRHHDKSMGLGISMGVVKPFDARQAAGAMSRSKNLLHPGPINAAVTSPMFLGRIDQRRSLLDLKSAPVAHLQMGANLAPVQSLAAATQASLQPSVAGAGPLVDPHVSLVLERLHAIHRADERRHLEEQSARRLLVEGALQQVNAQHNALLDALLHSAVNNKMPSNVGMPRDHPLAQQVQSLLLQAQPQQQQQQPRMHAQPSLQVSLQSSSQVQVQSSSHLPMQFASQSPIHLHQQLQRSFVRSRNERATRSHPTQSTSDQILALLESIQQNDGTHPTGLYPS